MDKLVGLNRFILITALLILFLAGHAQAAFPEYFDIAENYYTVFGGPNVSAALLGDGEVSRGDTVTLNINLMNKGVITGFKSEQSADPSSLLEQKLQQTEMNYEAQKTTAIGIVATLVSLDPTVKVKSGPQEAGSLVSGQQTEEPVKFTIEVSKNAPAGGHPLMLNLLYGFQENVQINGAKETDLGVTDLEVGLWYDVGSQNITIPVKIKEEAVFQVIDVESELVAGEKGLLSVTYKNTGELRAKDATVRLSISDPFSTTDDQAFIGSLDPGESAIARFNLKVDGAATIKQYSINSEISYEDPDGHSQISDTIKINTKIQPERSSWDNLKKYSQTVFVLVIVIIIGFGAYIYWKK